MEPLKIKKGLELGAIEGCTLSENEYDRMMFNDLLEFEGIGELQTREEVEKYFEIMCDMQECIRQGEQIDLSDRESIKKHHRKLYIRMKLSI